MLVLTRKLDEKILIGDDIKVTLLRVRGNTVRIGIEAPRDIRIVRGELERKVDHEIEKTVVEGKTCDQQKAGEEINRVKRATAPQLFVGSVKRNGSDATLTRAPLAQFVAAS